MPDQQRPRAEVVVDLDAIRHNIALLGARAPGAAVMAVVKADGYGHGALPVAKAAVEAGATWLGACSLAEALALREGGATVRILSWLDLPETDFTPGVEADIDISASSIRELDAIAAAAKRVGRTARVHLKIDTGLSRNGCLPHDWLKLVDRAAKAQSDGHVEVVAIWSHLACAEVDHPANEEQAKRFATAYEIAVDAGLRPMRHLANSAATLIRPDFHFDLVRVGIAMYGLNPVSRQENLRPAMTFRSSVAFTKRIAKGESVSYGQLWTATKDTNLALIPVGYADGISRLLTNRMDVWLGGKRRPMVGRVCMDQIVIDCGDDTVAEGDEVILFGDGRRGEPTATEWADTIGTLDYEVVTGMYRPRVVRRYR